MRGRRRHVALLGVWLSALLYTHTWAVFLAAGIAVGWGVLWRAGRVGGRGARGRGGDLARERAAAAQEQRTRGRGRRGRPPRRPRRLDPARAGAGTAPLLPAGVVYLTPLGVVPDPGVVDWRDALSRLRAGTAERQLLPLLDHLSPGRRILLVTPQSRRSRFEGPWTRAVRRRTREWRAALRGDPRVRALGPAAEPPRCRRCRNRVRAELFKFVPAVGDMP